MTVRLPTQPPAPARAPVRAVARLRRLARRSAAAFATLVFACGAPGEDALALAAPIRAEAAAVVAIQQAAELRTQPAGRAALRMVQDAGWLDRTAGAWAELARTLELDPDAAFDALFGRRAVLILEPEAAPAPRGRPSGPAWVLISELDADVAARLRRGLRPAPRGVLAGRPLFAVEQGRYELAIARLDRGRSLLLLAPAGRGSILEAALHAHAPEGRREANAAEPVAQSPARAEGVKPGLTSADLVAQLRELGRGEVHAAFRLGDAAVAGIGVVRGDEFQAVVRSSPGLLWAPRDCCIGYTLWPADIVHAIPDNAVLAAFGVRDRVNPALNVPALLPLLPGRAGDELPAFLERLRGRVALLLTEHPGEPGETDTPCPPAPIALDLLAEIDQLEPGAVAGDRAMAAFAALARGLALLNPDNPTPVAQPTDFEGRFPAAVRAAPLPSQTQRFGEHPTLRWVYRASQNPGPGGQDHRTGWWAARLGHADGGNPAMTDLGPQAAQSGPGVIVSFGRARPDRLAATLEDIGLTDLGGIVPAMTWIERLDWIAHPADNARIASKIRIHFHTNRLTD
ncbi:MAG: hypothetical protein EA378_06885 [Phycisphaerales bacterium]|nr:MAG: hypothetical protein EA378_06885 [Phycisphaerales bacterium]